MGEKLVFPYKKKSRNIYKRMPKAPHVFAKGGLRPSSAQSNQYAKHQSTHQQRSSNHQQQQPTHHQQPPPPQQQNQKTQKRKSPPIIPHAQSQQQMFTTPMQYTYTHANQYDILSQQSESDSESMVSCTSSKRTKYSKTKSTKTTKSSNQNQNAQPKTQRPPPITVPQLPHHHALQFLASVHNDANAFEIRHSPDGTKIFTANNDLFNATKNKLIESEMQFYTHLLHDEQTSKFVLQGFYATDTAHIMSLLNEIGIKPISVKNISVRNKRYTDHAVYLVHFLKKDKMKIDTLRDTARAIDHVRVRWEFFRNKRRGPIQCNRCMQYGHGGISCQLNPICIRCGESHFSNCCPLIANLIGDSNPRIPDEQVKCGLCGQNHPANYSQCEKRIEFMNRQHIFRERAQRRNRTTRREFTHAHQLDNSYFPSINPANASNGQAWTQQQNFTPNYAFPAQANENLFTTNELMNIMREMMSKLRNCQSKEQQLLTLGEIVMTHLYGST